MKFFYIAVCVCTLVGSSGCMNRTEQIKAEDKRPLQVNVGAINDLLRWIEQKASEISIASGVVNAAIGNPISAFTSLSVSAIITYNQFYTNLDLTKGQLAAKYHNFPTNKKKEINRRYKVLEFAPPFMHRTNSLDIFPGVGQ